MITIPCKYLMAIQLISFHKSWCDNHRINCNWSLETLKINSTKCERKKGKNTPNNKTVILLNNHTPIRRASLRICMFGEFCFSIHTKNVITANWYRMHSLEIHLITWTIVCYRTMPWHSCFPHPYHPNANENCWLIILI